MSTTTEPIVNPIVEAPVVSTQIEQEAVVAPTVEEPTSTELPVTDITEIEVEEESAVVPTTEEVVTKPTVTKRRTIFNPFGKSAKKEEIKEEIVSAADEVSTPAEEKVKKATKGFGFFSRSKPAPKVNDEENITVTEGEINTELPQIEQHQPIETENVPESEIETSTTTTGVKETVAEIAENVEQQVTEASQEVEQTTNNLTTAATNKRQSFISKLFGGNKSKKQEKEVTSADEEVVVEADNTTTTEEVTEQQTEEEETSVPTNQRPSSPLGRLTELFTSKKNNKKASTPVKEEAPAVIITDVEQDVAQTTIEENTNVTATPVVTASA